MIPDYWLFAYYLSPLHYVVEVGPNADRTAYMTKRKLEPSALAELFDILDGVVRVGSSRRRFAQTMMKTTLPAVLTITVWYAFIVVEC